MTENDLRVLRAVARACKTYDGYIPHGRSDHGAIARLVDRGLVENDGFGLCETCTEPGHEAPLWVLTTAGQRALELERVP